MTTTRVFNDFKRRYLAGEVEPSIKCTAYLMNSAYDEVFKHKSYFRSIADFAQIDANALSLNTQQNLIGSALASGSLYRNTYYRETSTSETDAAEGQLIVVSEDNLDSYKYLLLDKYGQLSEKYNEYLRVYGQFFLVGRSDEFMKLVDYCQENELETFVVVMYDDVENVIIKNSCFGCTQQHPFRGIFDGNGYSIYIQSITMNNNSYACGLFGYISEKAVVKNLKILAQPTEVNKYSLADDIDAITISVNNSEQLISLKSIKNGCNDVCIGVLAGVNHGTLENIVVSADVVYDTVIRPDVYLIQNKMNEMDGSNKKLIASNIINAGIEDVFEDTTKLSAFTNFCYPTQLCLNSSANMVPYVGYFNEGSFNTCTVDTAHTKEPLYRASTSGQYCSKAEWEGRQSIGDGSKTVDQMESHCSYFYDIYKHYVDTHTDKEKWFKHNKALAGISPYDFTGDPDDGDVYDVPETAKKPFSFRLGPNSKQAFLIGGVVGFNDGNISGLANVETMKFNNNVVALVGGVAGRASRGNLTDVHTRVIYNGTSGMYTDYITVNDNSSNDITCNITASIANLSSHTFNKIRSIGYYDTAGNYVDLKSGTTSVLLATNAKTLISFAKCEASPYARLYIRESTSDVYTRYYDYTTNAMTDDLTINATAFNVSVYRNGSSFVLPNSKITAASIAGDCHVCYNNGYAFMLRTQNAYSACSSYNDTPVVTGNPPELEQIVNIMPTLVVTFTSTYSGNPAECTLELPYSAFSANFGSTVVGANVDNFYQQSDNFTVKLPPVFNIGGMFGEYLYANNQSVKKSSVYASFKGFLPSGATTATSAENTMTYANKFANFACNITIDSVNKSNHDIYSTSSELASADCVKKNDLQCVVLSLINDSEVDPYNYETWRSDSTPTYLNGFGEYAYYLNCYNQIAPALVTTHYTDSMHTKGNTYWSSLGVQYEDNLFFKYGLNMGDTFNAHNYGRETYARMLADTSTATSGIYFNYPAQSAALNLHGASEAHNNADDQKMCDWHTVLTAAFNTNVNGGNVDTLVYVSRQLDKYPDHYPLYRGKASIDDNKKLTFAQSAYNTVGCTINVSAIHASAMSDMANAMVSTLDDLQQSANVSNYIYTYSSEMIDHGTLKPVACELFYSDMFMLRREYNTLPTAAPHNSEASHKMAAATATETRNKAYVLSSDSYLNIYLDNPSTFEHMATVTANSIGMPSTAQPRAITPEARTEVSGQIVALNHFVVDTPYEIQERTYPQYFGYSYKYAKMPSVSNIGISPQHVSRMLINPVSNAVVNRNYKNRCVGYDNESERFYVGRPVRIDESYTAFDNVPEPKSKYVCADDVMYITYEVTAVSSYTANNTPMTAKLLDKYLMSARIIDSVPDTTIYKFRDADGDTLTANSLVYGYIPPSADILKALNRSTYATLNCTGVSANDLQYVLLVDEQRRPILDIKLDVTAVDNAGYIVKFDDIGSTPYIKSEFTDFLFYNTKGGLAINIENGNK